MYNIYCDESCHLELGSKNNKEQLSMVLGCISSPKQYVREVSDNIRRIKEKHGFNRGWEIKWTKVSDAKIEFYMELIEFFFNDDLLKFRTIVYPDKSKFNYRRYTHNDIYYIMYFYLLREMINPYETNHIYIDKKDTRGGEKIRKLKRDLCDEKIDFNHEIIDTMQIIDSKDSEIMQLADLLIGAVSYANRGLVDDYQGTSSKAKISLVDLIRQRSGFDLLKTTLRQEKKFNIFIWESNYSLENME